MRVELLTSPGCPHAASVRRMLEQCLSEIGASHDALIERVGSYSSPTVLIDGTDVMNCSTDVSVQACRLDLPTKDRIMAALQNAGSRPPGRHCTSTRRGRRPP
ncbi:alkylmercury lyase [Mycolicibacterium agri]|uniref:Alkylmercury lyase n=1 Tax=Mycolicibacterium agri TaxID=36811 RepID=A0A2A7N4V6_MYCAG|nr:alkylmercury lyase [Mycolicibacterium agri]